MILREVERLRLSLKARLVAENVSPNAFAVWAGLSQRTVSGFLNNDRGARAGYNTRVLAKIEAALENWEPAESKAKNA